MTKRKWNVSLQQKKCETIARNLKVLYTFPLIHALISGSWHYETKKIKLFNKTLKSNILQNRYDNRKVITSYSNHKNVLSLSYLFQKILADFQS